MQRTTAKGKIRSTEEGGLLCCAQRFVRIAALPREIRAGHAGQTARCDQSISRSYKPC